MQKQELVSYFDSPERDSSEVVELHRKSVSQNKLLLEVIEAYPSIVVILNMNRQIIAFNKNALAAFSPLSEEEIYGLRLGEALNCVHAYEEIAGCGTSIFCAECGAAKALKLTKDTSRPALLECRITKKDDKKESSLDFRVASSCISVNGEKYILFTVTDIADEKRRRALERTFFHDVLNTASAVYGISEILPEIEEKDEMLRMGKLLNVSATQLISEIESQRDLLNAENNSLSLNVSRVSVNSILDKGADIYREHQIAINKNIIVNYLDSEVSINTDTVLLLRAVGNLVKNALEAAGAGETVTLSAVADVNEVIIKVNNPAIMPASVQLQVFQRSFSTKAKTGRGIGTYSVKLFVETFLGGNTYFRSSEKEGTTFYISLPYHVGPNLAS